MNEFGEKGALNIIDLLPNSTVLWWFYFFKYFPIFIQILTALNLQQNNITEIGAKQLGFALKTNTVNEY
jgi:hypothetical protein